MAHCVSKETAALALLRDNPTGWFGDAPVDQRDLSLIAADPVPWLNYNKGSFLRKIYHMKAGEGFETTEWIVETDESCKELVGSAGGKLVGFNKHDPPHLNWASVTVNVNITGTPEAKFSWGFLSTRPHNIRIFRGPAETCHLHPWDAMILRDCSTNTDNLAGVQSISGRKFDILCMKMCEDYDHPWVVIAIKDAGPLAPPTNTCTCQDTSACGCVIIGSDDTVD